MAKYRDAGDIDLDEEVVLDRPVREPLRRGPHGGVHAARRRGARPAVAARSQ
jgi:hypothetical protein